ncbi:helix-turn-helix transcriptional regulator [Lysobacter sp. K5869]|uniref:ArsR/SmtB family transcription factor n=1 Tax=Lysobacter sp. K5869 TaxID=2820808 RepID=UPI001C060BD4|nr:helix-turn-helix transcriptional regulator [Lysobacter sp. K5869]QWP75433.1 helix-turn-helix transcriptional regulator [Lysobacter sp. K5869]
MDESGPPLSRIAAAIGDPARALMLAALMDGRSRTAGELARAANVMPQTASGHLLRLVDAGLLAVEQQGRHRYHRLASTQVSHALEALMAIAPPAPARLQRLGPRDAALRHARTCYDHLAGEVAVELAEAWLAAGWIREDGGQWHLSEAGMKRLQRFGIAAPDPAARRPPLRPCLDWSERRPHIGGQLGASLLDALLANAWVRRQRQSRALSISAEGERGLRRWREA